MHEGPESEARRFLLPLHDSLQWQKIIHIMTLHPLIVSFHEKVNLNLTCFLKSHIG